MRSSTRIRRALGLDARWLVLAAAAMVLLGAGIAAAEAPTEELDEQLRTTDVPTEQAADDLALLARFYRERQMKLLWVDDQGASARAFELARALAAAGEDGLDPDDYGAAAVQALLSATRPDLLAELELRLSLGLIRIASDLASGRLEPSQVDPELFIHPEEVDREQVMRDAAEAEDMAAFVAGFRPDQDEYRRLKEALATYRGLAEEGGWPSLPEGETLDPGARDPRVAALRERLRRSGDLDAAGGDAASEPELYDERLVEAAKRFQQRHGLEQDGRIGKHTVAALNVPVEERIRQILLNLERRRWMPDDRGERYVFVNLADFTLKVVENGDTVFDTRVVVGAPYHRTPVFSADMTYVVVNPYWHVPPSIARNELLPKIKADPGYLAANNFELLSDWSDSAVVLDPSSIDWHQVTPETFSYKLRQGPGPGNALGRIKFMFPNRFNVYLHDTPARSLFQKPERTFSHGCIRVANPEQFGEFILAWHEGDWALDDIDAAIASGQREIVTLPEPIPVHVTYLTAWVNRDGTVHFRNDVYGRDAILADALLGPRAHL